jgi:CDP-diacylglycerol--glycerol-3-phosphate 3-phosphatidyltransferase
MRKQAYYIVTCITLYRLLSAPLLVYFILDKRLLLFAFLLGLSFLTDAVDGALARKYKVTSVLGARLDSVADDLTIAAAIIGAIVFKPEFLKQELTILIFPTALFLFQMFLAFRRYGKQSSFHTYGAKTAAVLQGIFLLLLFFLPRPVYVLFYTTVFVTSAELIEEIIMTLLLPRWEADVKGLYWVLKRKQEGK